MARFSVEQVLLRANNQLRRGELDNARALYESVLAAFPNNVRAKKGISQIISMRAETDNPESPPIENINLLIATYNKNDFQQVIDLTEALLIDYPFSSVSWNILAAAHEALGQLAEAEKAYRKALELNSRYTQAHYNMGNALKKQGKLDQAISAYRCAIELDPNYANAYNNLAMSLANIGEIDEAMFAYRRALEIQPAFAEAYNNMGALLRSQGRLDEALAAYYSAIKMKSGYAEAHYNASIVLKVQNKNSDAVRHISKAIELYPNNPKYRIAKMSTIIPILWDPKIETCPLDLFDLELNLLNDWSNKINIDNLFGDHIGAQYPFHLAYYPENMKNRMEFYNKIINNKNELRLYKERSVNFREKIRLGIVTAYVREHSVYDIITKGLLENLNTDIFRVYVYNVESNENRNRQDVIRPDVTVKSFSGYQFKEIVRAEIIADQIDFLFYPEIGMDPTTIWLANKRLAKFQAVSWGHPITSGLETMDFFISGDLIEHENSQEHYTEKLVRLPGTGCCTNLKDIRGGDCRFDLDKIASGMPTFIIPQNPQKFHPSNDRLIVEIAKGSPGALFLIPSHDRYPCSVEKIVERIEDCARGIGLGSVMDDRILSIPWMPQSEFNYLLQRVDVFLDLPSFSGYTTALQALSCGLPVITLEGNFMRQRLAAGLLRQAGFPRTIANCRSEYVKLAVEFGELSKNKTEYNYLRTSIKDCVLNVIDRVDVVRSFEQFVRDTVYG